MLYTEYTHVFGETPPVMLQILKDIDSLASGLLPSL